MFNYLYLKTKQKLLNFGKLPRDGLYNCYKQKQFRCN